VNKNAEMFCILKTLIRVIEMNYLNFISNLSNKIFGHTFWHLGFITDIFKTCTGKKYSNVGSARYTKCKRMFWFLKWFGKDK